MRGSKPAISSATSATFPDDDLLLNTGISFPISFASAAIHGAEAKLEIPRWGPVSGFISYSNMAGAGRLPVTGGLFLEDAGNLLHSSASFPVTQDQRNSAHARMRYQVVPRVWLALGASYGSGLPVEIDMTANINQLIAQYGQGRRPAHQLRPGQSAAFLLAGCIRRNRTLEAREEIAAVAGPRLEPDQPLERDQLRGPVLWHRSGRAPDGIGKGGGGMVSLVPVAARALVPLLRNAAFTPVFSCILHFALFAEFG